VVIKTTHDEADELRQAPANFRFLFARFPTSAGVSLHLELERPGSEPLVFETAWDVSGSRQREDVESLSRQGFIDVYFFGEETDYLFTRRLPLGEEQSRLIGMTIAEADNYLKILADEDEQAKDEARVRARFQREGEVSCLKCAGGVEGQFRLIWNEETKAYQYLCEDCSRQLERVVLEQGDIGLISMSNPRFIYWLKEDKFISLEDYWKMSQSGEMEGD
jgi:hypothetical protein